MAIHNWHTNRWKRTHPLLRAAENGNIVYCYDENALIPRKKKEKNRNIHTYIPAMWWRQCAANSKFSFFCCCFFFKQEQKKDVCVSFEIWESIEMSSKWICYCLCGTLNSSSFLINDCGTGESRVNLTQLNRETAQPISVMVLAISSTHKRHTFLSKEKLEFK